MTEVTNNEQVTPEVEQEIPSIDISGTCVLVDFSQGKFSGRKLDRQQSDQLNYAKNAERGASQVIKDIMDTSPPYIAINSLIQANGAKYRSLTLPHTTKGTRVCPNANLDKLQQFISEAEVEFWKLVDDVIADYDETKVRSRSRLGDLHKDSDFPDISVVRSKYHFEYSYEPYPTMGNFFLDSANRQHQAIMDNFKENEAKNKQRGVLYLMDGLKKILVPITPLANKQRLSDSLIENAQEFVEQLSTLNVTNNPEIENDRKVLDAVIRGVNMDDIRADEQYKKSISDKASYILDQFKDSF